MKPYQILVDCVSSFVGDSESHMSATQVPSWRCHWTCHRRPGRRFDQRIHFLAMKLAKPLCWTVRGPGRLVKVRQLCSLVHGRGTCHGCLGGARPAQSATGNPDKPAACPSLEVVAVLFHGLRQTASNTCHLNHLLKAPTCQPAKCSP